MEGGGGNCRLRPLALCCSIAASGVSSRCAEAVPLGSLGCSLASACPHAGAERCRESTPALQGVMTQAEAEVGGKLRKASSDASAAEARLRRRGAAARAGKSATQRRSEVQAGAAAVAKDAAEAGKTRGGTAAARALARKGALPARRLAKRGAPARSGRRGAQAERRV